jgi:hypothetical protein
MIEVKRYFKLQYKGDSPRWDDYRTVNTKRDLEAFWERSQTTLRHTYPNFVWRFAESKTFTEGVGEEL